jgi:hypothetical protein
VGKATGRNASRSLGAVFASYWSNVAPAWRREHPFAPLVPHGFKDATVETGIIRSWFEKHYWLGYGIVTDELLVVDVDARHGGLETWQGLTNQPTRALLHT